MADEKTDLKKGADAKAGDVVWSMPEKFAGKSAEDVARAYTEMETEFGKHKDELGKLRGTIGQWSEVWNAWKPLLERVEYQPERLAQVLDDMARQAAAAGDKRTAAAATAAADRVWEEISDPREQREWLESRFTKGGDTIMKRLDEVLTDFGKRMTQYINQYGSLAMRALEKKIANPKLDVNKLLNEAVKIGSGNHYDPMDWAERIMTQESEEDVRKRIRDEERAKLEEERANLEMNTGTGSRAGVSRYRMPSLEPMGAGNSSGKERRPTMNDAREGFLRQFKTIRPPE